MKVTLVQATQNSKELITNAASICYGKEEAKYPDRLLATLYNLGHHSVLEHVYFTWKIEGISRACLAQLTRHRHASFTVESQRYTKYREGIDYVVPEEIAAIKSDKLEFEVYMESVQNYYNYLISTGHKAEDARAVLPNATVTNLYMSCNLRGLIHLHSVRSAKGAQQEIKDLIAKMIDLVVKDEPDLAFMFKEAK